LRSCLILGFGRSGTAMTAGALAGAGYHTAGAETYAHPRNPRGFHESAQVNEINGELLAAAHGRRAASWLRFLPLDRGFVPAPELLTKMRAVTPSRPFLLKDPRFCNTLPAWRSVIRDARLVLVFRHPATTIASLLESPYLRGLLPAERHIAGLSRSWREQHEHILRHLRHEGRWLFLHYDQLLASTGRQRLARFLDANVDAGFVDPTLRRETPDLQIPSDALDIYGQLCEAAEFRPQPRARRSRHQPIEASLLALVGPDDLDGLPELLEDARGQRGEIRCELVLVDRTGGGLELGGAKVVSMPMGSPSEALKAGWTSCSGRYVALARPGTRSAPNRLARTIQLLEREQGIDAVTADCWLTSDSENSVMLIDNGSHPSTPPPNWSAGLVLRREALDRIHIEEAPTLDQALRNVLREPGMWAHIHEPLFHFPVREFRSMERAQVRANREAGPRAGAARVQAQERGAVVERTPLPADIGAIYPCFEQPKAVIRCLQAFRRVYPDSDAVLVCDGGLDFSHVARHFAVQYQHEPHLGNGNDGAPLEIGRVRAFLARFFKVLRMVRHRWVLYLEDDVRVERPVELGQLRHSINGCRTDMGLPLPVSLALRKHNRGVNLPVQPMSGYGGTIFDREFFLALGLAGALEAAEELLPILIPYYPLFAQDYFLTAITLRQGGTIGPWAGHSSIDWPWYPFHRQFGSIEILHKYKAWYHRDLSPTERDLLEGRPVQELPPTDEDALEAHLAVLERICCAASVFHGDHPEGGLFTRDYLRAPVLVEKQRNLHALVSGPCRYLETGFNVGQSALAVLMANPENRVLSFDQGKHAYARPCAQYLQRSFPGRLEVVWGDSKRTVAERLAEEPGSFDVIHIDGGHDFDTARADLLNCRAAAGPDTLVLVDDVQEQPVKRAMAGIVDCLPGWPRAGSPCPQALCRYQGQA